MAAPGRCCPPQSPIAATAEHHPALMLSFRPLRASVHLVIILGPGCTGRPDPGLIRPAGTRAGFWASQQFLSVRGALLLAWVGLFAGHRRAGRVERQRQIVRCALRPTAPAMMSRKTLSSSRSADPPASLQPEYAIDTPTEAAAGIVVTEMTASATHGQMSHCWTGVDRLVRLAWLAVHQAFSGLAVAQPDGLEEQGGEVDPQRLQRKERHPAGDIEDAGAQEGEDEAEQAPHLEPDVLDEVVVEPRPISTRPRKD